MAKNTDHYTDKILEIGDFYPLWGVQILRLQAIQAISTATPFGDVSYFAYKKISFTRGQPEEIGTELCWYQICF